MLEKQENLTIMQKTDIREYKNYTYIGKTISEVLADRILFITLSAIVIKITS